MDHLNYAMVSKDLMVALVIVLVILGRWRRPRPPGPTHPVPVDESLLLNRLIRPRRKSWSIGSIDLLRPI